MEDFAHSIIEYGKLLDKKGYTPGISGNISIKHNEDIYITASGSANGYLENDDIVNIISNNKNGKKASSEKSLHKRFYELREDIKAIIHVHSPYLTAFASSSKALDLPISPEIIYCFDSIPLAKYALPGSDELVEETAKYFKDYDVVLMQNHGVIVGGKDLKDAYLKLDLCENYAKTILFTNLLGGANILTDNQVKEINLLKRK